MSGDPIQKPTVQTAPVGDTATTAPRVHKTPDKPARPANMDINYTPMNPKSSSVPAEHQHENVKRALEPGILEDVSKFQECSAGAMLETFLGFVTEEGKTLVLDTVLEAVLPIANNKEIRKQLVHYCKSASEVAYYKPFILAMNLALEKLERLEIPGLKPVRQANSEKILLQRNDPKSMNGRHHKSSGVDLDLKPDVEIISFRTAMSVHSILQSEDSDWSDIANTSLSCSSLSKDGPSITWEQNLSSLEFKHTDRKKPSIPEEYTVGPLVVKQGKKRFLHPSDDGLDHERTAAANIQSVQVDPTDSSANAPGRDLKQESKKRDRNEAPCGTSDERENKKRKTQTSDKALRQIQALNKPVLDKPTQAGFYGAERLTHSVRCTHSIVLIIENEYVWIWWFDRQGAIQAEGINFIQSLPHFLALLLAFQRFTPEQWGICPLFTEVSNSAASGTPQLAVKVKPSFGTAHDSQEKPEIVDGKDYICVIDEEKDEIDVRFSLKGRATRTSYCTVQNDDHSGQQRLVAKFSWQEDTRIHEADLISEAYKRLSSHSDPVVRSLTKHLPNLFFKLSTPGTSTSVIRKKLGLENPEHGARSLRGIVCDKLSPITNYATIPVETTKGQTLWRIFWQCFMVHLALWTVGVQHCDISPGNLMCRQLPGEDAYGVLNDFDLARLEGSSSMNRERTGTFPFLALALLSKEALMGQVPRLYSHDAESFIWTLIWVLHRFRDNRGEISRDEGPCRLWLLHDPTQIYNAKKGLARDVRERRIEGADSSYHYRAECLGKYFSDEDNTDEFAGKPISFVVEEIKRILQELPRKFNKDPAYVEYQTTSSGLKPVGHRNTDVLNLPLELLAVVEKVGNTIVD